jgi:hypothetical protein
LGKSGSLGRKSAALGSSAIRRAVGGSSVMKNMRGIGIVLLALALLAVVVSIRHIHP